MYRYIAKPNSKYESMVQSTSLHINIRLTVILRLIFRFLLFTGLKFLKETTHVTGKRFDHEKAQCQKTLKSTKKKRKEDEGSKCVKGTNIHLQVKGLSKYLIIKYYAILYRLNIIIFCVQSVFYNNVDI